MIQHFLKCLVFFLFLLIVSGACGQPQTTNTVSSEDVTTESISALTAQITSKLKEANDRKTSDPDFTPADEASTLLTQAVEQLRLYNEATSETAEHEKAVREAPGMLEKVRQGLTEDEGTTRSVELPSTTSTELLNQWLEERKAELAGMEQSLKEIDAEQQRRTQRLSAIPKELAENRQRISETEFSLKASSSTDDPMVITARNLKDRATLQALIAQRAELEKEQARYNAREELLPLGRQFVNQRIDAARTVIEKQTNRYNDLRKEEAAKSARDIKQAAREASKSHPLISAAASENSSITEEMNLARIVDEQERLALRISEVKNQTARIAQQDESLRSKFEAVGYSDSLGLLLRKQRNDLPSRRNYREALELQQSSLTEVNLKSLEIQDSLNSLVDPSRLAREMMAENGLKDAETTQAQDIRRELTALLQARKDYLLKSRDAYEKYFQTLLELNTAEEELTRVTASYAGFIDERILWLPSAERVSLASFTQAVGGVSELLNWTFWKTYAEALVSQVTSVPLVYFLGVLLLCLLILSRHHWKRKLSLVLEEAGKNRLAQFRSVIQALGYAAAFVSPIPLFLLLAGLPLRELYTISVQQGAIANGMVRAALVLFPLLYARILIRRNGICEVFFAWPESSLKRMRHALFIIAWFYIPTAIIVRASQIIGTDVYLEMTRFALFVTLIVVGVVFFRLLRPGNSILAGTPVYASGTWLYHLRYVIMSAVSLGPVVLAVACLLGYIYTVTELSQRLSTSFWLGVAALLLNEVIFFWILVKRRRLAIEDARRRREVAKSQMKESEQNSDLPAVNPEPALDIAAISQQAGRLLHIFVISIFIVGLWAVWAGVLPALKYLDTQPLWSVSKQVTETIAGGTTQTRDVIVPVTLADFLLVLLIVSISVVAIRNIPGLLDITIFQKFSVQTGERYAFNTLIRYVIILVAMVYVFYKLGLQWKQIQWLAAAVSVGLGFGLQEIFANFVSGLILLFERPVRVGDIVTVGDVTGRVTQIRIRATTIVNWDHKEHLLPNKELITGRVLNWTLSDRMVRLLININIAFDSDYDQARNLLLKIAREAPLILDEPAPAAAVEKFGLNGVEMFLAAYLPNLDNMTDVRHEMLRRIEVEFRAAGIKIPMAHMNVTIEPEDSQS